MSDDLIEAVSDLTRQIILLREDLRPELKKAAIFREKNAVSKRTLKTIFPKGIGEL